MSVDDKAMVLVPADSMYLSPSHCLSFSHLLPLYSLISSSVNEQVCSNLAVVTEENCCRYLELADLISAPALLQESISTILAHLDTVTSTEDFAALAKRNPGMFALLYSLSLSALALSSLL